ncbi:MAG: hypothetical protein KBC71_02790 [Candidatus Pacebacteria bacterium]|nr:hypothetical protein [Candidatus Paceibacterota bacterium]
MRKPQARRCRGGVAQIFSRKLCVTESLPTGRQASPSAFVYLELASDRVYVIIWFMEEDRKKNTWKKIYTNLCKNTQKLLQKTGLMKSPGRQPYHVGWLTSSKTLEGLRLYLHSEWGFGKATKVAKDKEVVLSWAKITDNHEEYFLRVYRDGEIRGHFEKLPVTGVLEKPSEMGEKEAKEEFLKFLGEFYVEKKTISELKPLSGQIEPEPEIIS